jgi:hypothetical protein
MLLSCLTDGNDMFCVRMFAGLPASMLLVLLNKVSKCCDGNQR